MFGNIAMEDTGGDGEALLCVAGLGMNASHYAPLAERLESQYRLIRVNLPGFAGTEGPKSGASIEACVHVMTAAIGQLGIESATLVGHSLGALVMTELAARNPEVCDRLVLLSPLFLTAPAPVMHPLALMPVGVLRFCLRVAGWLPSFLPAPESMTAAYCAQTDDELLALAIGMRSLVGPCFEGRIAKLAPKIDVPTLVIWGDHDPLAPEFARNRARKSFPEAAVAVLEDCGHTPMWERPDQVADAIHQFTSHTAPHAA